MLTLAPALTEQPEVLIVDEPTLGLAPRVSEFVLDLFRELKEDGATILLVGESPHGLVDIADAVTLVHGGRVVWSGTPGDLNLGNAGEGLFQRSTNCARAEIE